MSETPDIFWPEDLPQSPLADGWQETPADNVLRTRMEQGPAKLRRRGSAAAGRIALQFLLDAQKTARLHAFYTDDLQGGVMPFALPHPLGGHALCRFAAPPDIAAAGGGHYRARLTLESLRRLEQEEEEEP